MSLSKIYPFDNPSNYTFPPEIVFAGSKVIAALVDNIDQEFIQTFANNTGFVYDSSKAEFVFGLVRQINKSPINSMCWATFTNDVNLNNGGGVLNGSAVGGAAIAANKLDLNYNDVRYVFYDPVGNADFTQTGAIKIKYTPNYTGSPTGERTLFLITKAIPSDTDNLIWLSHQTNGHFKLHIKDSTGANIVFNNIMGIWSPTVSNTYEIELNVDITLGETRLYLGGNQFGLTETGTGTRDSSVSYFSIGTAFDGVDNSNGSFEDLIVFNAVQHTTNYTPGYTLPEAKYEGSKIELPQFTYSGIGSLQAFTDFITVQSGFPKFIINDLWFSSSWGTSDGTYAQSNSVGEVLANISTLPALNTLDIDIIFQKSNTISTIDNLITDYTGQLYAQTDPVIKFNSVTVHDDLISFLATVVETGSDSVTFFLTKGLIKYYHDGAAWVISNGTLGQSNSAAEILTNVSTFTDTRVAMCIYAILHSADGSTTPELSNVTIQYDFAGDEKDEIETCILWLYQYQLDNLIAENESIDIQLKNDAIQYKDNVLLRKTRAKNLFPDVINGSIEAEIIETSNMAKDAAGKEQVYRVFIGKQIFEINVPNVLDKNLIKLLYP